MPQSYFLLIILKARSLVVMLIGHCTVTPLYIVQTYYFKITSVRKEIGQKVILAQDSSDPAPGL